MVMKSSRSALLCSCYLITKAPAYYLRVIKENSSFHTIRAVRNVPRSRQHASARGWRCQRKRSHCPTVFNKREKKGVTIMSCAFFLLCGSLMKNPCKLSSLNTIKAEMNAQGYLPRKRAGLHQCARRCCCICDSRIHAVLKFTFLGRCPYRLWGWLDRTIILRSAAADYIQGTKLVRFYARPQNRANIRTAEPDV